MGRLAGRVPSLIGVPSGIRAEAEDARRDPLRGFLHRARPSGPAWREACSECSALSPMLATVYENPVYSAYFADPFVFRHDDFYYAVGTGRSEAAGAPENERVFPMLRSRDLTRWEPLGKALKRPERNLGNAYWAPEIACADSIFYLYYSVGFDDRLHQLRVATSRTPYGPYEDTGQGLTDVRSCPFAIDPHPFRDADGRYYLFHARDFLDLEGEEGQVVRAGTALVVHELSGMTRLSTTGRTVLRATRDWQRFEAGRAMYGRHFDWHTLEGPSVLLHEGRYYCFYSGGRWENETYGVDYAVADHVLGPYRDAGAAEGPRVLRSEPGRVLGPGHNSIVLGPNGKTWYLAYHAWAPDLSARRLCIDPLEFTPEGPRCRGPSYTPVPLL